MAIKVVSGNKAYYDTAFGMNFTDKSFDIGEAKERTLKNVYMHFEETDDELLVVYYDVKVEILEENGDSYAKFTKIKGDVAISYDKNTRKVTDNITSEHESYDHPSINEWLTHVTFNENKYLYNVYCSQMNQPRYYSETVFKNTAKFINEGTFSQLEGVIKNLGLDFFITNIRSSEFELKNAKKLHRAIELPKQVLDFIKKYNFPNLLCNLKLLANDDSNQVIYLTDWYETLLKYKNMKSASSDFDSFVNLLGEVKNKFEQVDLFRLLPYLISQRVWYEPIVEDKFCIPYDELRTYRDYVNLGGHKVDPYPSCLISAHNIAVRNKNILLDEEICRRFEEVVEKYKDLEWTDPSGKYIIKAPVKASDFIDEGNALHHCLATYIELVANGQENVMFLRSARKPDESLVTFAFDEDYNAIEVKEIFNVEVEDPEILDVLKKWKERNKRKFK
jgi:hypothetical protein